MKSIILITLCCISWHVRHALCSRGDSQDPYYRRCLPICVTACDHNATASFSSTDLAKASNGQISSRELVQRASSLSVFERIFMWSCASDCRYKCMWVGVDQNVRQGYFIHNANGLHPVQQYHGKWPFVRILGIQEPASVLFSLLNAMPHVHFLRHVRHRYSAGLQSSFGQNHILAAFAGIIGWTCAVIFHTRDTTVTERMDYHSAFAYTLSLLNLSLVEVIEWRWVPSAEMWGVRKKVLLALVLFWSAQVGYLNLVNFDYGLNIAVNIVVYLFAVVLFHLRFARPMLLPPKSPVEFRRVRRCRWATRYFVIQILGGVLLEVYLDFPPILYVFDAHSLWHLLTIFTHSFYYIFAIEEIAWREANHAE